MKTHLDHLLTNLTMRHEVRGVCLPKLLPLGVRVVQLPGSAGVWRHVVHCPNDQLMEQVVASFRRARLGYKLETYPRKEWWVKWLNPKGRSFTYSLVWNLGVLSGAVWGSVNLARYLGF